MTDAPSMPPIPDAPAFTDLPQDATPTKPKGGKTALIVILIVIGAGIVTIGGYLGVRKLLYPYTATATLQVDIDDIKPEEGTVAHMVITTHAELVNTPAVRERAICLDDETIMETGVHLEIRNLEWFESDPTTANDRLARMLTVKPIPNTSLISVSVRANDAKTAAILATAVAKAYELQCLDDAEQKYYEHYKVLERQIKEIEQDTDKQLLIMRRLAATSAPQVSVAFTENELRTQLTQRAILATELQDAKETLAALEQAEVDGNLSVTPEAITLLNLDPTYASLLVRKDSLLSEQRAAHAQYGEDHPSITTIDSNLAAVDESITQAQTLATANLVTAARSTRDTINRDVENLRYAILTNEAQLTDIKKHQTDLDVATKQHAELQGQLNELEMELAKVRIDIETCQRVVMRNMAEMPKR
jgi:uncharacterized protein involved in exopolysaccharide biosynthesis